MHGFAESVGLTDRPDTSGMTPGQRRQALAEWSKRLRVGGQLYIPPGASLCPQCCGESWIGDPEAAEECPSCTIGIVFEPGTYVHVNTLPDYVADWTFASYPGPHGDAYRAAEVFARDPAGWCERSGKPGLLLIGPTGRGKTGLAASIAHACRSRRVKWLSWAPFLAECRRTFDSEDPRDPHQLCAAANDAELLIIDDFGAQFARAASWRAEMAQVLLDGRMGRPLIVTTMLTGPEIEAEMGPHITSRLAGLCLQLVVEGDDLRRREAA